MTGFYLKGHSKKINGSLVLSCGSLLSWSEDRTLRIWDLEIDNSDMIHTENYENTDEKQHNARYNDTGYGGERKFQEIFHCLIVC